jgi:hypothetical protein
MQHCWENFFFNEADIAIFLLPPAVLILIKTNLFERDACVLCKSPCCKQFRVFYANMHDEKVKTDGASEIFQPSEIIIWIHYISYHSLAIPNW